jgi:hypothetical protein
MRAQKGVEAQGKIFEGTLPIGVSVMALLHRDDPEMLSEACQQLANAFPQGDSIWETQYPTRWRNSAQFFTLLPTVLRLYPNHLDAEYG